MLKNLELSQVQELIGAKQDFVLNIVASWCPDCTEGQSPNLPAFAVEIASAGMDVINLLVQMDKRQFLSKEHEQFVAALGGHGFPRTVLFKDGVAVDADNVEIITAGQLAELSGKFRCFF